MDIVQQQVENLLDGKSVDIQKAEVKCAHTGSDESFTPLVKQTVCYIVGGVLFNDKEEILLIQEAKQLCYGKWYLPAGRLEPNETLEEGAIREVLEEAGLDFNPETLLSVEIGCGTWYRFIFTGTVYGGTLKTLNEADGESLQANWFTITDIEKLQLRARDILPVIKMAIDYKFKSDGERHPKQLSLHTPHSKLLLRAVMVYEDENGSYSYIRSSDGNLPSCEISPHDPSITTSIGAIFEDVSGNISKLLPKIMGVLTLEFSGTPRHEHDGLCITLLVKLNVQDSTAAGTGANITEKYTLCRIKDDAIISKLSYRLQAGKNIKLVPLR